MSEWLNNLYVIHGFGEWDPDREANPRADRRERPRQGPQVLHGGPRMGETAGLPATRKTPLAYRCPEGAGAGVHSDPGEVQGRPARRPGSRNGRISMGLPDG